MSGWIAQLSGGQVTSVKVVLTSVLVVLAATTAVGIKTTPQSSARVCD